MERKYCSFPVHITKAWVDPQTKKKRIAGVASDDKLDQYRERFAVEALNDMVTVSKEKKALKPEEGLADILETHYETFGFGYVVNGWLEKNMENNSTEYHFEAELKDNWPQGDELWNDIKEKKVDKQLSVGGLIPDWENDYGYEEDTFTDEEGTEVKTTVGVIKRFKLEHISVTPFERAANPRTHFTSAKSLGFKAGAVYKSAMDEGYQKRIGSVNVTPDSEPVSVVKENESVIKNFIDNFRSIAKEVVLEVFGEREDIRMNKVEKAKGQADELRKFITENPEDFTEEVIKSLGVSFVTDEPKPEESFKSQLEAFEVSIKAQIEEVKKSIPEMPTMPDVPKAEDIAKAVQDTFTTEIGKIDERLKAIETATPPSQNEPGVTKSVDELEVVVEPEAVATPVSCWN